MDYSHRTMWGARSSKRLRLLPFILASLGTATRAETGQPTPVIEAREIALPPGSKVVSSIAGLSSQSVYLIVDEKILHYDGRRAQALAEQPLCPTTVPIPGNTMPANVGDTEMQWAAAQFRRRPASEGEDYGWNLARFQALLQVGSEIRLYGYGDFFDVRGSHINPVWGSFVGSAFHCKGRISVYGGEVREAASDGESYFLVSLGSAMLEFDASDFPYARLSESFPAGGVTATGPHDVWTWHQKGSLVFHLNGFTWEPRAIEDALSVVRVVGDGQGQAFALVDESEAADGPLETAHQLLRWDGERWQSLTTSPDFVAQGRGVLPTGPGQALIAGTEGRWYRVRGDTVQTLRGPALVVRATWRDPDGTWWVSGEQSGSAKLVVIRGQQ